MLRNTNLVEGVVKNPVAVIKATFSTSVSSEEPAFSQRGGKGSQHNQTYVYRAPKICLANHEADRHSYKVKQQWYHALTRNLKGH